MDGINVSQAHAQEMEARGHQIYHDPATGFWVQTDGVARDEITYHIRRTGDQIEEIPTSAWKANGKA